MKDATSRHDLLIAATIASGAVMIFFIIYWSLQIQDVLELLEMAYG